MSGEGFLGRWSRRKLDPESAQVEDSRTALPASAPSGASPPATPPPPAEPAPQPLPDVATLTPESDFTPFMRHEVPADVRRQALKQLFRDPHFNTMDMLDVYVDDYSVSQPIPDAVMKSLRVVQWLAERNAEHDATLAQQQSRPSVPPTRADEQTVVGSASQSEEHAPPPSSLDSAGAPSALPARNATPAGEALPSAPFQEGT